MKNILLVEDDPFISDIYKTKLEKAGLRVLLVTDGKSAIKKMKEEKPDLMLLDIVLPNADGWEILEKIKKDPELKNCKIVIISNLGQKGEIEKGFLLGASKYLIKAHYTPSEIVREVQEILK